MTTSPSSIHPPPSALPRDRPFLALVLLIAAPLLIGGGLAPHAYNALQALGETTDAWSKLTDAPFERVANRCVLILAVLMLVPAIRFSGLARRLKTELKPNRTRWRELGAGFGLGLLSITLLYIAGGLGGIFTWSDDLPGAWAIAGKLLTFVLGALFIGLFEEIFFRGFVHNAFRSLMPWIPAVAVSSAFFSGIHFLRPSHQPVDLPVAWYEGYALLGRLLDRFDWNVQWPFMLTLFLIGLTLAIFYEKRGNLFLIAGLHGGWVLALRTFTYLLSTHPGEVHPWFGRSDNLAQGPVAIFAIVWFLAAAVMSKRREADGRASAM